MKGNGQPLIGRADSTHPGVAAHAVECPKCYAKPNQQCSGMTGPGWVHHERSVLLKVRLVLDRAQHLALDNDRDRAQLEAMLMVVLK